MTRSVYPWLSTKRSCEAWEVSKVWKESYGQISTVQPSGTQIWTSSPRSWTLSPALCQKHFGRSNMSNSDRSAKSNSYCQCFLLMKVSACFSWPIKAVSASIRDSFLQRMPFRCRHLCLKLCCLNISDSQVQGQILDAADVARAVVSQTNESVGILGSLQ